MYARLCTHTSLYLTNKGNRHILQRMILVTFSNEIKIQSSKNRTFKNPIFLGKMKTIFGLKKKWQGKSRHTRN